MSPYSCTFALRLHNFRLHEGFDSSETSANVRDLRQLVASPAEMPTLSQSTTADTGGD